MALFLEQSAAIASTSTPLSFVLLGFGCFGATALGAQGFLQTLCSGIPPGWLQEPYGVLGIKPRLPVCKANALPAMLSR